MASIRETKTKQRHADIYEEYERILQRYGELATQINRKPIWEEIAEKFRCSSEHVYRVVINMNKCRKA